MREATAEQEDPTWTAEKELCMRNGRPYNPPKVAERVSDANHMADEAASMSVGDRCAVTPGDKRGTVRCGLAAPLSASLRVHNRLLACLLAVRQGN